MNVRNLSAALAAAALWAGSAGAQDYEPPAFLPPASLQALAAARPLPRMQPITIHAAAAPQRSQPDAGGPMRLVRLPTDGEPAVAPKNSRRGDVRTWFDAPPRGMQDELMPRPKFLFLEADPFAAYR